MRLAAVTGRALAFATSLVTVASCGSRTGLFGVEPGAAGEGGVGSTSIDASRDASRDAPEEAAVPCVPGKFDLDRGFAQLVFVIDRSGSMDFSLTTDDDPLPGEPTRWQALRGALSQALAPFDGEIAFGAKFFPEPFAVSLVRDGCFVDTGVAVPPKLSNLASILAAYDAYDPRGGTPTTEAIRAAAELVKARRGVARTLVVATDGAPNCNSALDPNNCVCTAPSTPGGPCAASSPNDGANCLDDVQTVEVVRQIYENRKIPVFVVGIGVTGGFAPTLDAMALAGGRPRSTAPHYYPAETPAELSSAFTVVRDSVAKCSYVTPSAPNDPDLIDITIDQKPIARDPTHVDGWDWIDQEYGQLQLFGSACAAANAQNVDGTVVCERPDASIGSDR